MLAVIAEPWFYLAAVSAILFTGVVLAKLPVGHNVKENTRVYRPDLTRSPKMVRF